MRLYIVIPAHNEEHRIDRTLSVYRAGCPDPDIRFLVALDDCTDGTAEIVRGPMRPIAASSCTSTRSSAKAA